MQRAHIRCGQLEMRSCSRQAEGIAVFFEHLAPGFKETGQGLDDGKQVADPVDQSRSVSRPGLDGVMACEQRQAFGTGNVVASTTTDSYIAAANTTKTKKVSPSAESTV